jgi:ABC-2 type transport system ATP-binding protein
VIFSTHTIQEAERYGQRLLVIADGERLFDGSQEQLRAAVDQEAPEAAGSDFESAFVAYLHHRGH